MHFARLIISLMVLLTYGGTVSSSESTHLVAPLENQGAIDGCSWSASSKALGRGDIFISEYDDSRSLMNIDGSDVELVMATSHGDLEQVGDILERTYRAEGVLVRARYRATSVCADDDEHCEITEYEAIFDVSKGSKRQVVQATGDVGC